MVAPVCIEVDPDPDDLTGVLDMGLMSGDGKWVFGVGG